MAQDFVEAVRNGSKPAIDVYDACEWTAVGLLSELSVMNGGRPGKCRISGKHLRKRSDN